MFPDHTVFILKTYKYIQIDMQIYTLHVYSDICIRKSGNRSEMMKLGETEVQHEEIIPFGNYFSDICNWYLFYPVSFGWKCGDAEHGIGYDF